MRVLLIALLAAISYAQTGSESDVNVVLNSLKNFNTDISKIDTHPAGLDQLQEEMQTGHFFNSPAVPVEDAKEMDELLPKKVVAKANPSALQPLASKSLETEKKEEGVNSGLSDLATQSKASFGDSQSALKGKADDFLSKPLSKEKPAAASAPEKLEVSAESDDGKTPSLDAILSPSVASAKEPVSAAEISNSYDKDFVIAILLLSNVIMLFGWINACNRSKDILTYEANLLEEI